MKSKLVLAIAACLGTLLICEGLLRLLGVAAYPPPLFPGDVVPVTDATTDRLIGWKLPPDSVVRETTPEYSVRYRSNRQGFRSPRDFEVRTGVFTNVSRTLTVKLKDCCELNLEPNLAHPDGGEKRRYTDGTAIALDTVVPCGSKSFKKWTVKGPNDSGDPLYQIVTDTNEVLFLTMDGDYLVKATCKCGGGVEPFAGMALLLLGIGVAIRKAS